MNAAYAIAARDGTVVSADLAPSVALFSCWHDALISDGKSILGACIAIVCQSVTFRASSRYTNEASCRRKTAVRIHRV